MMIKPVALSSKNQKTDQAQQPLNEDRSDKGMAKQAVHSTFHSRNAAQKKQHHNHNQNRQNERFQH